MKMKAIKLFSMAVAALMMAACSKEDNDVQQPAQQARMIPFSATIGPAGSSTRTTITEGTGTDAGKLMVAWKGDEWIALVHNGKKDKVQVTKVNDDGSAVIEGEIDATGSDGEDVVLVYPADAVASVTSGTTFVPNTDPTFLAIGFQQDGTLGYIGSNLDAREGSGTLKISGGTATLNNNVTMSSKIAIWKLTLTTDGTTPLAANQVTLSIGTNPIAATAVNATGKSEWTLCVVPATLALYSGGFTISAKVGTDTYTYTKAGGVSLETSKYYQSTLTMEQAYAANQYNEGSWDGTKVIFTKQTAASVTAVADANSNVTWSAGWYTVSGNVTINGNVTLSANTHLILQDGATLTINGQLDCNTNGKDLYIYGQKNGDGKLNVNNSSRAIRSNESYRIEIHGGEITAAATGDLGLLTGYLAVYGGKLTATSGGGNGINFQDTFDVYGGEVEATSNATSSYEYCFGIRSGSGMDSDILTVYGGKVTATGNGIEEFGEYGSGFGCYVKSGTSGIKFYFSDNGTDWGDGTSYASATDARNIQKRYAKAE